MREVIKIVDDLTAVFFLQGWDIDVLVYKEPDQDEPNTAAKLKPQNCYRAAALYVYPRFFEEDARSKRDIIIHELCHIITGIQNGLINTASNGTQVTAPEAAYAQKEETSWMAQIIANLMRYNK
jgi:hypothetical protein